MPWWVYALRRSSGLAICCILLLHSTIEWLDTSGLFTPVASFVERGARLRCATAGGVLRLQGNDNHASAPSLVCVMAVAGCVVVCIVVLRCAALCCVVTHCSRLLPRYIMCTAAVQVVPAHGAVNSIQLHVCMRLRVQDLPSSQPLLIVLAGADGLVLHVNSAVCRVCG